MQLQRLLSPFLSSDLQTGQFAKVEFTSRTRVTSATVVVGAGTSRVRRGSQGAADTAIGLGDLVAGHDRSWWRGTVSGPSTVDATWVRVRDDG